MLGIRANTNTVAFDYRTSPPTAKDGRRLNGAPGAINRAPTEWLVHSSNVIGLGQLDACESPNRVTIRAGN
jgi:hypothetical protein